MLKKLFIAFTLVAFLNFIGCYSSEVISKEELDKGNAQIDFNEEIYVTTQDYSRYHFLKGFYQIQKDTLYGEGSVQNAGDEIPFKGKIAMDEVTSFEQSKPDAGSSAGLTIGIIAIGAVALGLILLAMLSDAFNPD